MNNTTYEWSFTPYNKDYQFYVPGGHYVLIDPGYLMERRQIDIEYLRDLSSLNFQDAVNRCIFVESNNDRLDEIWHFPVWKAAYGEGSYPVYNFTTRGETLITHLDSIPTDSGYFSLVPRTLVEDFGLADTSLGYHFHNDFCEYFSQMIDSGDVQIGKLALITSADNLSDSQECEKIICQYLDKYCIEDKAPFFSSMC